MAIDRSIMDRILDEKYARETHNLKVYFSWKHMLLSTLPYEYNTEEYPGSLPILFNNLNIKFDDNYQLVLNDGKPKVFEYLPLGQKIFGFDNDTFYDSELLKYSQVTDAFILSFKERNWVDNPFLKDLLASANLEIIETFVAPQLDNSQSHFRPESTKVGLSCRHKNNGAISYYRLGDIFSYFLIHKGITVDLVDKHLNLFKEPFHKVFYYKIGLIKQVRDYLAATNWDKINLDKVLDFRNNWASQVAIQSDEFYRGKNHFANWNGAAVRSESVLDKFQMAFENNYFINQYDWKYKALDTLARDWQEDIKFLAQRQSDYTNNMLHYAEIDYGVWEITEENDFIIPKWEPPKQNSNENENDNENQNSL